MTPRFPDFKHLTIGDRRELHPRLRAYAPVTSELTFTNLFIWRGGQRYRWSLLDEHLLILAVPGGDHSLAHALPPVGPAGRLSVIVRLLDWMAETGLRPLIHRADPRLAAELADSELVVSPIREHFDYLYRRRDLAELDGAAYETKRNHINALLRRVEPRYKPLGPEHLMPAKRLSDEWCRMRRCKDELDLVNEWEAIRELLNHYDELDLSGAVIFLDDRLKAFTVGERLNDNTAVIHIEKGDPEERGVYPLINRLFCRNALSAYEYVNREQDLGLPGLRRAKQSYRPVELVEKFDITRA